MHSIQQDEKTGIMYHSWETASAEAVFLLVHGMGASSARWNSFGEYFFSKDVSSYALELKGFGETEDVRGHIDSFDIYYKDIAALYDIIERENPHKKIFLVAESMGALISFCFLMYTKKDFGGFVCISPAFSSRLKIGLLRQIRIALTNFYDPKKQFNMPFDSLMCTRDLAYQKIIDSNPYEHRFASAKLLLNIVFAQIWVKIHCGTFNSATLFLLAGEDDFVDTKYNERVFDKLCSQEKKLIEYPGMLHSLSVELGREEVFEDIHNWIVDKI